ncbi:helix-turn-helix transcriptional regulator [Streptomyces sp. WMMC500]|uniref:response regulator transcription factor n=1 Tax=Streptomyces sp. WMMC500 TaxID=3015154 RepID=UPI00248B6E02|nr:helix-turn-helix transcriptional regulator [Streptomyces sp. WMMC500]WBB58673.1 helix-turn-helix transcriptional regulator [Streptomyces sp. WMMC500]
MGQGKASPCEAAAEGRLRAPGDPGGIPLLTDRERQTLYLVGTGAGNRLIARRLGISERTVRAHLSNAVRKIEVRSRSEAAVFAFAYLDLVDIPAPREPREPPRPRTAGGTRSPANSGRR